MIIREVLPEESQNFNQVVNHPLQSWQWGEFREKTGVKVVRIGRFDKTKIVDGWQITFHQLPKLPYTIGYLPKSNLVDEEVLSILKALGQKNQAIFIKLEPNIGLPVGETQPAFNKIKKFLLNHNCVYGRPLFTKYTFQIDLTCNTETLLSRLKPKTRYNIGLAFRKGVKISEDNSDQAFQKYLDLTFDDTTKRQHFYAHDRKYHQNMWSILKKSGMAHLLKATWQKETLVTWIVFVFNKNLYYPYGASSSKHRQLMASNLMLWEAIRFGKKLKLDTFDLWGSLGPNPDPKDPWFGFHRFKKGYNPNLIEFVGTFDYIIDQPKYKLYKIADNLRWRWLKIRAKLPI